MADTDAPVPSKRYAQKTALKYRDTKTAFTMGDIRAKDLDAAGYFKNASSNREARKNQVRQKFSKFSVK